MKRFLLFVVALTAVAAVSHGQAIDLKPSAPDLRKRAEHAKAKAAEQYRESDDAPFALIAGGAAFGAGMAAGSHLDHAPKAEPVPEPAAIVALGVGGAALIRRRRRAR